MTQPKDSAPHGYRDVRMPTHVLGHHTGTGIGHRVLGGMWHSEKEAVTLLLFPDHSDDCRALVTITPEAAEQFANHLLNLAKWTREYAASHPKRQVS